MTRFRLGPVVLLAASLLFSPAAVAQTQDGKVFKDWRVRCLENPQTQNLPNCVAEHVTVDKSTDKPVMLIRAHHSGPEKVPVAVITVPLSVRLPPGLRIQIDSRDVLTLPYRICVPDGCVAQFRMEPDILAGFKKGISGNVIVQVPPGREVSTPFSLQGFTAALAAVE